MLVSRVISPEIRDRPDRRLRPLQLGVFGHFVMLCQCADLLLRGHRGRLGHLDIVKHKERNVTSKAIVEMIGRSPQMRSLSHPSVWACLESEICLFQALTMAVGSRKGGQTWTTVVRMLERDEVAVW